MRAFFGELTLDDATRQIFGPDGEIHVSPKAFQLLSILIEERPRAMAKNQLHEKLWPDTYVSEGGLASLIAELRASLGDDAREPRYIRTVFGFGYSFCADVRIEPAAAVLPIAPEPGNGIPSGAFSTVARRRMSRVFLILAALGGAALSRSYADPGLSSHRITPAIRSIAVLPFNTVGSDQGNEHLGLGLTDVLITRLSNLRQVMVRPTSAVAKYTPQNRDSVRVGRELGVDAILEGNVRRSADRIRVTVQLINVKTRQPIWGGKFDDSSAEIFTVEDSISEKVSEALAVQLNRLEKEGLSKTHTQNTRAYELYVKGKSLMFEYAPNPSDRKASRKIAIDYLRQAVAEDPGYALGYAALADAYAGQAIYQDAPAPGLWVQSELAARRALELDENLSEAHSAVGTAAHWRRDWVVAEKHLRRALQLNPSNVLGQRQYAWLLQNLGRFDEAIPARERALALDPLELASWREAGWTYYLARRYDDAIQRYETALLMDPNFAAAYRGLSDAYDQKGMHDRAIASGMKALEISERGGTVAWLGYHYARAGDIARAKELLERLQQLSGHEYVAPYHVAVLYVGLGRNDDALAMLEKAYSERSWVNSAFVEPAFDPLRNDPRFIALLRRAGFPIRL
jgi:TolB-like protein/DNA-binding winged helix-turn-helix (wHTH) protein/Tfp pilus assembly protein PilF